MLYRQNAFSRTAVMMSEQQSGEKKFVRKKILIDNSFQLKFILKALIPLVILMTVTVTGLLVGIDIIGKEFTFQSTSELITRLSMSLGDDFTSTKLLSSLKFWGIVAIMISALISVAYIIYVFLFFSHRIAGPILRFNKTLEEILDGNLNTRIQLRDKDEFKETADHFNNMLDSMRERVKRIDQYNNFMTQTIDQMIPESATPEDKARLEKLKDLSRGISDSIREFRF